MIELSKEMFCKLMAGRHDATLEQIYQAARECGVDPSTVTVGALVYGHRRRAVQEIESRTQPEVKPTLRIDKGGIEINVRTEEGRKTLDAIVISSLARERYWVTVEKLDVYGERGPKTVSGLSEPISSAQLRKSLHRLYDKAIVDRRGQARGTSYRLSPSARKKFWQSSQS